MKLRAFFPACILIASVMQFATLHAAEYTQLVSLVSDPWPPYILGELGNEATGGVGAELLHAIFERLDNVRLSIPLVPWNRALRQVKQGTKDGIGIVLKTPERELYMDYTEVLFESDNMVWYAAERFPDGFEWQRYADFQTAVVGVVRGHSYGEKLDQMISTGTLSVVEVSSARHLFAMLDKGRIDLAFADRLVGNALLSERTNPSSRTIASQKLEAGEVFYIAFSKKSEARLLIPAINRVISELGVQGVIENLVGGMDTDVHGPGE